MLEETSPRLPVVPITFEFVRMGTVERHYTSFVFFNAAVILTVILLIQILQLAYYNLICIVVTVVNNKINL